MLGAVALNCAIRAPNLRWLIDLLCILFTMFKDSKYILFQLNVEFRVEEENMTILPLMLRDAK